MTLTPCFSDHLTFFWLSSRVGIFSFPLFFHFCLCIWYSHGFNLAECEKIGLLTGSPVHLRRKERPWKTTYPLGQPDSSSQCLAGNVPFSLPLDVPPAGRCLRTRKFGTLAGPPPPVLAHALGTSSPDHAFSCDVVFVLLDVFQIIPRFPISKSFSRIRRLSPCKIDTLVIWKWCGRKRLLDFDSSESPSGVWGFPECSRYSVATIFSVQSLTVCSFCYFFLFGISPLWMMERNS